jgi:hypothetical protein
MMDSTFLRTNVSLVLVFSARTSSACCISFSRASTKDLDLESLVALIGKGLSCNIGVGTRVLVQSVLFEYEVGDDENPFVETQSVNTKIVAASMIGDTVMGEDE